MAKIFNKNKKAFLTFIIAFIMLFSVANQIAVSAEVPAQKTEFYLNDFTNTIETDVKNFIVNVNDVLYKKTGGQVVFTIVDFTDGVGIVDYTHDMFLQYNIGDKKENNGILIVVAEEEEGGLYQFEMGSGVEKIITAAEINNIFDKKFKPHFDDYDTSMAIAETLNAIVPYYEKYYNVDVFGEFNDSATNNNNGTVAPLQPKKSSLSGTFFALFIIVLLIIVLIIISSSRRRYVTYYSGWQPSYGMRPRWSPFRSYRPSMMYHNFYAPPRSSFFYNNNQRYGNQQNQNNQNYGNQQNYNNQNYGNQGFGNQNQSNSQTSNRPTSSSTPFSQRRTGGGGSTFGSSFGGQRSSSARKSSPPSSSSSSRGGSSRSSFGGGSRGGGGGSSSGGGGGGRRG